jgi:cytochrome c5
MRKIVSMLGILVAVAIISASCGESGNKAKETAKKATEKVEKAAEKVAEKAEEVAEKTEEAVKAVLGNVDHGKEIYDNKCMACHMTGVTGAPKLDEKERWATIATQGLDVLYNHSIKGFTGKQGVMPPKGGFADLTETDMKDAVSYMLKTAGAM